MRRTLPCLALVAALGLVIAVPSTPAETSSDGPSASDSRRPPCPRGKVRRGRFCVTPPPPVIRGGRYQGSAAEIGITMEINTTRKTILFFYGPAYIDCVNGRGVALKENAPSGSAPPSRRLASNRVRASFTYNGTRSDQDNGAFGFPATSTTTWQVTGRFPTARKVTGTLKISFNHTGDSNPDPNYQRKPYSCQRQVNFTLNAN